MQLPLNIVAHGSESLQQQITQQIRCLIHDGRLAPGTRMPATRELASDLGVSRNTVIGAFQRLIAEGCLESREPVGTFVAQRIIVDRVAPPVVTGQATPPFTSAARQDTGMHRPQPRLRPPQHWQPHHVARPHAGQVGLDFWVGRPDARLFPLRGWGMLLARALHSQPRTYRRRKFPSPNAQPQHAAKPKPPPSQPREKPPRPKQLRAKPRPNHPNLRPPRTFPIPRPPQLPTSPPLPTLQGQILPLLRHPRPPQPPRLLDVVLAKQPRRPPPKAKKPLTPPRTFLAARLTPWPRLRPPRHPPIFLAILLANPSTRQAPQAAPPRALRHPARPRLQKLKAQVQQRIWPRKKPPPPRPRPKRQAPPRLPAHGAQSPARQKAAPLPSHRLPRRPSPLLPSLRPLPQIWQNSRSRPPVRRRPPKHLPRPLLQAPRLPRPRMKA